MDSYDVELKPSARRELDALPDQVLPRVTRKLALRTGDWRILYIIDDAAKLISVTRIAHRREVYE